MVEFRLAWPIAEEAKGAMICDSFPKKLPSFDLLATRSPRCGDVVVVVFSISCLRNCS